MSIQKDAGELLILFYNNKVSGKEHLQQRNIEEITQWDKDKITFALEYLIRKDLLDGEVKKTLGSSKTAFILLRDINPEGIDIVEDDNKFQKSFNFSVGIPGIFSFSWGARER